MVAVRCQLWCFIAPEGHPSTLMKFQVQWSGRIVRFLCVVLNPARSFLIRKAKSGVRKIEEVEGCLATEESYYILEVENLRVSSVHRIILFHLALSVAN